jgi:type II secretion system protein L
VSDILTLDSDSASACTVYSTSTIHATRLAALPQDTGLPTGGEYFGGAPQFLEYGPLQKFAEVAVREPPINLLQGPFTPAHSGSAGWERWRVAVLLCVAGAFLSCVISGVDLVRAHRAEVRLDAELHAAYAQALPGTDVSRLPAPRLIVESRVRRLMSAGHDGMIGALDSLGVAVSTTPGVSVKSINFHDGSMEAVLTAADLSALNQIQQDVGPQSRLAGVTTPDPQHAEGRLEITGLTP